MQWKNLLSAKRLGSDAPGTIKLERSPFQRDFDRVIFSGAFRRLQNKTQVFPLVQEDYVRTRLTHSLETSSIGRSLGTAAGVFLKKNYDLGEAQVSDVGAIVATAALSHDIGNPPLGHAGEEAIRFWFTSSEVARALRSELTPEQSKDFEFYEGNAQGFRVLSVLEMADQLGGMQLTCATLGSFAKYPSTSASEIKPPGVAGKKFNFFNAEKELFAEVAANCGLIEYGPYSYARHPLAYLVEAADDIAYLVVDFEDGARLGMISQDEVETRYLGLLPDPSVASHLGNITNPVRRTEYYDLPRLLIRETEKGYELRAALPGYEPESIQAEVTGDFLTLRAERKTVMPEKARTIHRERRAEHMEETIQLPGRVDAAKVEARYADGILTISLPRETPAAPENIRITVER